MATSLSVVEHEDLLDDLSRFLDNYVDVEDGDYGEPRPNRAMQLKQRVDELLDVCERERRVR